MKTKDLVLIAIFAALTAIGGFLNIPTPLVPFSLQFLFCAYAGVFLGARNALLSQLLYIGIGLAGLPVFTKGGGIGYLFQPSFGFCWASPHAPFIVGLIVERSPQEGPSPNFGCSAGRAFGYLCYRNGILIFHSQLYSGTGK